MPNRKSPLSATASRGHEVRERLMQAAVELIPRHGWGAVSTRMIAEQAGVTPGLVHYHFGSVQALLSEAAIRTIRALVGGIAPSLHDARTAGQALNILFGALDGYSGHDPVSLLMAETYLAAGRDDALRGRLTAIIADFRQELSDLLREREVPNPTGTAAVIAAAMDGVVLHRSLGLPLPASTVTRVLGRAVREEGNER